MCLFFFKQKTAYEMRISDWSSDVCSSDLHYVAVYPIPALVMTFLLGGTSFALGAPIQMLMINTAKGSEMLAASVSQASFNIGNALGAFLGGLPIAMGYGYASPEWVGAAMAGGGALFAFALDRKSTR